MINFGFLHSRVFARFFFKRSIKLKPLKIVIGASGISQEGWVTSEIRLLNLLKPVDWDRYFSNHPIDAILAEHVWEHLTKEEGIVAAKTCFQYLTDGGYLRVAVPDGLHPDPKYIEWVKPGGVGPGANDHKTLYSYKTFKEIFESAGFKVDLLEYFDECGTFHYKEWNTNEGMICRSKRFDERNKNGELNYTSIILDARKIGSGHDGNSKT